ncbi:MAG TPA: phasin family protein [Methyloceanibacter sp.]|nr:phasin family protein [Methyloceanibacter sp.]
MATDPNMPQAIKSQTKKPDVKTPAAKKPARRRTATAKASQTAARKTAAAKPVSPEAPKPVSPEPPVLVNAVKPDEMLPESALMGSAVDSIEQSLKAAMPAAVAVNRKLVDIAQTNMNSGLALARDLASAKSPVEMMQLGMTFWQEHMGVFQTQAQELRTLSAALMTTANEPIRAHIRRA